MLPSEKNDIVFLLNILENIGKIWKYAEDIADAEEFFEVNEQMNFNASVTLLTNVGENIAKITESLKKEYSNIEWQQIKDFRNRIVHDYDNINIIVVYEVITEELKVLKQEVEKIIKEKVEKNIFDIEEIKISKDSKFYKYVDFDKFIEK